MHRACSLVLVSERPGLLPSQVSNRGGFLAESSSPPDPGSKTRPCFDLTGNHVLEETSPDHLHPYFQFDHDHSNLVQLGLQARVSGAAWRQDFVVIEL